MKNQAFISGLVTGVGSIWLSNSIRDRRKRALVRDKGIHYRHKGRVYLGKASRDLSNRLKGAAYESRHLLQRHEEVPDQTLEARVRAKLGRLSSHPSAIEVRVNDGEVILLGHALQSEADEIRKGISSVRGVEEVIDRLDRHESSDNIPDLQGQKKSSSGHHSLTPGYVLAGTLLLLGATFFAGALPLIGKNRLSSDSDEKLPLPKTDWNGSSDRRESGLAH